jgi:mannosyltransferase OCH1-like enzyme
MHKDIPRIIHFVWFGPVEIPCIVIDSWIKHNPGYEIRIWNERNLFELRNQMCFDKTNRYNQKSDIARYEILLRYGGIYVDCDIICLRPVEPLFETIPNDKGLVCVWEKKNLVSNSIIACPPNNTVMKQIVENIDINTFDLTQSVWKSTGPLYFMNIIQKQNNIDTVYILDYYYFNLCCDFNLWEKEVLPYHPDMQCRSKNRDIRYNRLNRNYTIRDCYGVQLWCGGKKGNYMSLCKKKTDDIVKNLKRYIRYMYMN